MGRLSTKDLCEASDLREEEIELEALGGTVLVQGLGAAFSNEAQSQALEMKTIGNTQIASVNTALLEEIQLCHGLKDPKLSREEARKFMEQCGPSVKEIIAKIDELSGVDKDAIEEANARFQGGGERAPDKGEAGLHAASARGNGSAVPARAGA